MDGIGDRGKWKKKASIIDTLVFLLILTSGVPSSQPLEKTCSPGDYISDIGTCCNNNKCHPDPLMLKPARVVVRYGDSVSVNCSTPSPDHDGMGWEALVGGTDLMENVTYVTWTVESLTQWTIDPFCYINFGTEQPSKELPVTLYKTPDDVNISQVNGTGPMLEGTEYQLQCKIIKVAPLQNLTVKWYLQNKSIPVIPHAFDATDGLPKDAIHTISIIPSRTDHLAQYQCAAQLDLGPDGPQPPPTKTSSPLTVSVLYAPEFKQGNNTVDFEPGADVKLTCIAEGNPPPTVRWTNADGNNVLTATGERQSTIVNIRGATSTHAKVYVCVATNEVGSVTRTTTLNMRAFPTILNGSECVLHLRTLICVCISEGVPLPTITWPLFKNRGVYSITTTVLNNTVNSTFSLTVEDHYNTSVECFSKNDVTTINKTIIILKKDEEEAFPTILSGSECVLHLRTLICVCISEGVPLPTITWPLFKNRGVYSITTTVLNNTVNSTFSLTVEDHYNTSVECFSKNDATTINKTLIILKKEEEDFGQFRNLPTSDIIDGESKLIETAGFLFLETFPKILNGSECVLHLRTLICVCISEGVPLPTITWPLFKNRGVYSITTTVLNNTVNSTFSLTVEDHYNTSVECFSKNDAITINKTLIILKKDEEEVQTEGFFRIFEVLKAIIVVLTGITLCIYVLARIFPRCSDRFSFQQLCREKNSIDQDQTVQMVMCVH